MIGFVHLSEAADAIGRAIYGERWRPIGEIGTEHVPSDDELIEAGYHLLNEKGKVDADAAKHARNRFASTRRAEIIIGRTDDAIEGVICLLAKRAESGEIETFYQSIDGLEPLDCSKWRASNWRSYFVNGEIEQDLPLLNGQGTARCRRAIFVRRRAVDRLIETLPLPPLLVHTNLRYASDKPLIQGALQALKRGEVGNPLQAAKLVYKRADGPTADANLDRLRKLIGDEWKALTS
jgi:hypothetical protein